MTYMQSEIERQAGRQTDREQKKMDRVCVRDRKRNRERQIYKEITLGPNQYTLNMFFELRLEYTSTLLLMYTYNTL